MRKISKLIVLLACSILFIAINSTEAMAKQSASDAKEKLVGNWDLYDETNSKTLSINIKEALLQSQYNSNEKLVVQLTADLNFESADITSVENLSAYFLDGNLYMSVIYNTPFVSEKYFYVFNMNNALDAGLGHVTFYGAIRCEPSGTDKYDCDNESAFESNSSTFGQKLIKADSEVQANSFNFKDFSESAANRLPFSKVKGIWDLECLDVEEDGNTTRINGFEHKAYVVINSLRLNSKIGHKVFNFKYIPESDTELSYDILSGALINNRVFLNVPSLEGVKQFFFRLNQGNYISETFDVYAPYQVGLGFENSNENIGNCVNQDGEKIVCDDLGGISNSNSNCRIRKY